MRPRRPDEWRDPHMERDARQSPSAAYGYEPERYDDRQHWDDRSGRIAGPAPENGRHSTPYAQSQQHDETARWEDPEGLSYEHGDDARYGHAGMPQRSAASQQANAPATSSFGAWDDGVWGQPLPSTGKPPLGVVGGFTIPADKPDEHAPRGKRRGRRGLVTAVVLLLVLALIAGGAYFAWPTLGHQLARFTGSTATATPPLPTPTVPAGYKQFTSSAAHYALNYPQQWNSMPNVASQDPTDHVDQFQQPNTTTQVIVEQAQGFGPLSNADIIHAELVGGQRTGYAFSEITSAAGTQTLGGEQFMRREYNVSVKSVKLHMVVLGGHHAGRGYAIILVSDTTSYTHNQPTFQTLLGSFHFTS